MFELFVLQFSTSFLRGAVLKAMGDVASRRFATIVETTGFICMETNIKTPEARGRKNKMPLLLLSLKLRTGHVENCSGNN
jgi:hypothetical protein